MTARDSTVSELLRALLATADTADDGSDVLCDEVVLHRLDGTQLAGRAAVLDALRTRDRTTQLVVLATRTDGLAMALEIDGVPGRLEFAITAALADGRLVAIHMLALGPPR